MYRVISSGLIYDRMNKELIFALLLFLMAAAFAPAPFGGSLYPYVICLVLSAVGMGVNDAGNQILYLLLLNLYIIIHLHVYW